MADRTVASVEPLEGIGLPPGFARLRDTSLAEGYPMLARLEQRYREGRAFDGPGEGLFAASAGEHLLGVAGVCVDPYLDDPGVGRVRHVYVDPAGRRRGIGRALLGRVVERAAGSFVRLRLRTDHSDADRFYRALGFSPTSEPDATHVLERDALASAHRAVGPR
jgi:GNAT superfamily N-acetyltransferase